MPCVAAGCRTAAPAWRPLSAPAAHWLRQGLELLGAGGGEEITMTTRAEANWGGGRGLAAGLSLCPGHSRLAALCAGHLRRGQPCGRRRGRQAALFMLDSRRKSMAAPGPLPCAPTRTPGVDESAPAHQSLSCSTSPMTDLETTWSRSFSGFLRSTPEQAQVFMISIHAL